jgi:hypothetical protein
MRFVEARNFIIVVYCVNSFFKPSAGGGPRHRMSLKLFLIDSLIIELEIQSFSFEEIFIVYSTCIRLLLISLFLLILCLFFVVVFLIDCHASAAWNLESQVLRPAIWCHAN